MTAAVQCPGSVSDHDMRQDLQYWIMISGHWPLFPARHTNMSCRMMREGPGSQVSGSDHLMAVDMWWVSGSGGWQMKSISLQEDLSQCPRPVHHIPLSLLSVLYIHIFKCHFNKTRYPPCDPLGKPSIKKTSQNRNNVSISDFGPTPSPPPSST